jgi:prepilin-type N-terminal cleavage/methylation domain-containing protein
MKNKILQRGFTLIEIIVSVGLFTIVMTLASGAYLLMIGINRQAQAVATGINNLSFALETMTYNIRTGNNYTCASSPCSTFSFHNSYGQPVSYSLSGTSIHETRAGTESALIDPSVAISSLAFYTSGALTVQDNDYQQARVTIIISGTVSSGHGESAPFTIETGATMRGSDL